MMTDPQNLHHRLVYRRGPDFRVRAAEGAPSTTSLTRALVVSSHLCAPSSLGSPRQHQLHACQVVEMAGPIAPKAQVDGLQVVAVAASVTALAARVHQE